MLWGGGNRVQICEKCLMLSTRPRLTYNKDGVCSACQWAEEKKSVVDWDARQNELRELCLKYKSRNKSKFDVVVPVSGGKDSSSVAHKLKHLYGMNPLCVNISHHTSMNTEINEINLNNFVCHGFDATRIYPNQNVLQRLDTIGLTEYGQPLFGWLTAMVLAPLKIAMAFDIPFIMYGEEGEVEYGGTTELKNKVSYTIDDTIKYYLSGVNPTTYLNEFNENELWWWLPPSKEEIRTFNPTIAHWSYFENWNSYNNYEYAKQYVNLKERAQNSPGTYNKFAQTDSILYPLHVYLMYLKFGFGRCSQDVCIDIRIDRMSRDDGIKMIEKYDEVYPIEYEEKYLKYYNLTKKELYAVFDKFANKDLLIKKDGYWKKNFKLN